MPGGGGARRGAAPGRAYGNRRLQQAGTARKAERPRGAPSRASQPSRPPHQLSLPTSRLPSRPGPLPLPPPPLPPPARRQNGGGRKYHQHPPRPGSLTAPPAHQTGLPGAESLLSFDARTEIYPRAQPSGQPAKAGSALETDAQVPSGIRAEDTDTLTIITYTTGKNDDALTQTPHPLQALLSTYRNPRNRAKYQIDYQAIAPNTICPVTAKYT